MYRKCYIAELMFQANFWTDKMENLKFSRNLKQYFQKYVFDMTIPALGEIDY